MAWSRADKAREVMDNLEDRQCRAREAMYVAMEKFEETTRNLAAQEMKVAELEEKAWVVDESEVVAEGPRKGTLKVNIRGRKSR